MPRLYLTPQELEETPLGLGLVSQISQLQPGVLDKLLARASQRCDKYCDKRLQAPSSSTLSQLANAGATSVSVASTLTLDNLDEQAIIFDQGLGTQETVLIQPGGVSVTSWQSPYPGTLTLATPLQFSHSSGGSVQYVYQEVREAGTASTGDPYTEALQSQAAQLALAHLPPMQVGLTRIVFLSSYPVINVLTVEHAYSFDTTYNLVYSASNSAFTGGIILEAQSGYLRFRVGTVITPQGMVRTTYQGGYQAIPDDIKIATSYYLADTFAQLMNPFGATDILQGKRRQAFPLAQGKSPAVQLAQEALDNYRRRT